MDNAIHIQKADLRRRCREARGAIPAPTRRIQAEQIRQRLRDLPEMAQSKIIHIYWPLLSHAEVDTRGILQDCLQKNKQTVLPVVTDFSRHRGDTPRMRHVLYKEGDALVENRWGIMEPVGDASFDVGEIDMVVVPAIAVDRKGHRLGNGYGYYDEFLATVSASRICLCYHDCLVASVPHTPYDEPMDIIVTDRETIRRPT